MLRFQEGVRTPWATWGSLGEAQGVEGSLKFSCSAARSGNLEAWANPVCRVDGELQAGACCGLAYGVWPEKAFLKETSLGSFMRFRGLVGVNILWEVGMSYYEAM